MGRRQAGRHFSRRFVASGKRGGCCSRHGAVSGHPCVDCSHSRGGDGIPPEQNSGRCPVGGRPWRKPGPIYGWKFCGGNDYAPRVVHGVVFPAVGCHGSPLPAGTHGVFWMQSAWILQASYAVVWLVCRLCSSELAGATFCFVVTLAGVIVSVSAPDPAAVSPLSALLFYATPMPYWLALGGGYSIPWQAVGYGAGVTALCLAAALAITTVRDVE